MNGFIIDLDGTIYQGNQLIDGAKQFIKTLQTRKMPYLFVTNNSVLTPREIADKIGEMGLAVKEDDIFTSSLAAASYLKKRKDRSSVSIVGGNGLRQAFETSGFDINGDTFPEVLVQGVDPAFTYQTLYSCIQQLQQGADYILTNPDLLIPVEDGFLPGAGTIAAAIQAASNVEPLVIGKPSSIIMEYAMERIGMNRENIWVIGDNLMTDIQAGSRAGCSTAWVMTGIGPQQKDLLTQQNFKPDIICRNLTEFMETVVLEAVE